MTCREANGSTLPDAGCRGAAKPAAGKPCATNCSVQANSSVAAEAPTNSSAADTSDSSTSSSGSSSVVLIAGVAAGSALALVAAGTGALLYRRRSQRRRVEGAQAAIGKWSAEGGEGKGGDVIPLPKHLRPISTGRTSRGRSPRANLSAAAGAAAAVQQQQHGGTVAAADAEAYAAQVAQLQQYVPEYHVVHMPSPRLAGTCQKMGGLSCHCVHLLCSLPRDGGQSVLAAVFLAPPP